jgi:hypothetical protein
VDDFPPILPSVDADENDVDDRTLEVGKGPVQADVGDPADILMTSPSAAFMEDIFHYCFILR